MNQKFPLGINLGADNFTSAYINGRNDIVTVASIEASQAWKEFFLETLRVEHNRDEQKYIIEKEVEGLIISSLSSIRQATEARLGRSPIEITAISYPEHFKGNPFVTAIAYTTIKSYPEIKDVMQVKPYLNVVRLAYSLNTTEALGYAPGADLIELNSLLIHLDFQKDFLEVSLMSVDEYADLREVLFRIDNFGGKENVATPEELASFRTQFQNLLEDELRLDNPRTNPVFQAQLSDFRFIISSGSAAPSEFKKLRDIIVEIEPEFSERFRHEIDPYWVAAVGAATCAKAFAIKPPVSHIDSPMPDPVNPVGHRSGGDEFPPERKDEL